MLGQEPFDAAERRVAQPRQRDMGVELASLGRQAGADQRGLHALLQGTQFVVAVDAGPQHPHPALVAEIADATQPQIEGGGVDFL